MCQNCRSAVALTVAQDCISNKKQESLVSVNVTVKYRHVFLGAASFSHSSDRQFVCITNPHVIGICMSETKILRCN